MLYLRSIKVWTHKSLHFFWWYSHQVLGDRLPVKWWAHRQKNHRSTADNFASTLYYHLRTSHHVRLVKNTVIKMSWGYTEDFSVDHFHDLSGKLTENQQGFFFCSSKWQGWCSGLTIRRAIIQKLTELQVEVNKYRICVCHVLVFSTDGCQM